MRGVEDYCYTTTHAVRRASRRYHTSMIPQRIILYSMYILFYIVYILL